MRSDAYRKDFLLYGDDVSSVQFSLQMPGRAGSNDFPVQQHRLIVILSIYVSFLVSLDLQYQIRGNTPKEDKTRQEVQDNMARAAKSRKTFKYPAEEEASPAAVIDEQQQEEVIESLASQDASITATYKVSIHSAQKKKKKKKRKKKSTLAGKKKPP